MSARDNRKVRQAQGERGVAIIEFAGACGLMVTLLFGILAYGEVLAQYIQLRYAVGEISRQVAVGPDAAKRSSIFNSIRADMVDSFKTDSLTATCATFTYNEEVDGTHTKVVINGDYQLTDSCRLMPAILPIPEDLDVFNRFLVRG